MNKVVKLEGVEFTANCLCDDCEGEIAPYMMKDKVWAEVAQPHKVYCFQCFSDRLGRRPRPNEFMDCELNEPWYSYIKDGLSYFHTGVKANVPHSDRPKLVPQIKTDGTKLPPGSLYWNLYEED